jgi:hypothetical protein
LSVEELRKVHDGYVVFHHHGFSDEFVIIAAYKKDLIKRHFPIPSFYFCDDKTATVMSGSLINVTKWASLMKECETEMDIGVVKAAGLVEIARQG